MPPLAFAARYPAEAADHYCHSPERLDELLEAAPWRRFVVVGDSIAEGVTEATPGYGPEPWADRVAAALRRRQPDLVYENLGVRGLRASEVRATQLEPALELQPDLAAVICGGNDMLVHHFDAPGVERELDAIVGPLRVAGADVITFSMFDMPRALDMPPEFGNDLSQRLYEVFERTRAVAHRHGTLHVELAPHPASAERQTYASDFQHASSRGHAVCASLTIERLAAAAGG